MTSRHLAEKLAVGDLVYKGSGKVLYRVWCLTADGSNASVVKATTMKDPARGCFYPIASFTAPW